MSLNSALDEVMQVESLQEEGRIVSGISSGVIPVSNFNQLIDTCIPFPDGSLFQIKRICHEVNIDVGAIFFNDEADKCIVATKVSGFEESQNILNLYHKLGMPALLSNITIDSHGKDYFLYLIPDIVSNGYNNVVNDKHVAEYVVNHIIECGINPIGINGINGRVEDTNALQNLILNLFFAARFNIHTGALMFLTPSRMVELVPNQVEEVVNVANYMVNNSIYYDE